MKASRSAILILAPFLSIAAPPAMSQESARIEALGGEHVAGLISDPYTDLNLSPVHAIRAESLIVWYTRKPPPSFGFELPHIWPSSDSWRTHGFSFNPSNEIAVHGMKLGTWRAAVAAEWTLRGSQNSASAMQIVPRWEVAQKFAEYNDDDADAWMLDAAAARTIDANHAVGLRLRGSGYYRRRQYAYRYSDYEYEGAPIDDLLYRQRQTAAKEWLHRRVAFELQASAARMGVEDAADELTATVSLSRLHRSAREWDDNIRWNYDLSGDLSSYNRDRSAWSDWRDGDLWSFGATYRRQRAGGVRIYAGGHLSTASFDAAWDKSHASEIWNYTPSAENRFEESFDGPGNLLGGGAFAKVGLRTAPHRTLDFHLGLHASFESKRSEESADSEYLFVVDGVTILGYEAPVDLVHTDTKASLRAPVSIEFRPASFFTYFAAFIPGASWRRTIIKRPLQGSFRYYAPSEQVSPSSLRPAAGARRQIMDPTRYEENVQESLEATHAVTLGFSFRHADRLMLDFYAGSEIVPRSLSGVLANVRYAF